MTMNLQNFHESDYHRPDQPVVADGGAIAQPAIRSRRNVFIFGTFAFTVGALLIVFNSPYRNDFLAPGPLSSVHANLLEGHGADRCAACHDAGNFSVVAWAKDAVSGGTHITNCQSDLCMKCHDKTIAPEFARNPHGMDPNQLASYTKDQVKVKTAGFDSRMIFKAPVNGQGEIACSACHREHHGAQINLTSLTDRQCQTCHQNTFHSFEIDHPEFTKWPQVRRDRIAFDHVTHFAKHFPGKNAKFECSQCHVDDNFQNVKLLSSFEDSCAACHNQQVVDSSQNGMKLFSLPMIDTQAIADANLSVGQWPESATGDFDGPLPPMMRLLLASDENAARLLEQLGADFEFSDIDPDDPEQVRAGVELVWHIKELLYELSVSGNEAIRKRLGATTGRTLSRNESEMLTQGLNASVFQEAAMRWLPNLNVEVPLRRQGLHDRSVSWIPSEQDALFQIALDDDRELAPNPLKGLMGTPSSESPQKPVVRTPEPLPEPDLGSKPVNSTDHPRKVVNQHLDNENNPDVLVANPLKKLMGQGGAASSEGIVRPNHEPSEQGVADVGSADQNPATPDTPYQGSDDEVMNSGELVQIKAPKVLAVTANSGWFRDDINLSIAYRPLGHADPFLVSWTNFTVSVADADCKHEFKPLFEKLTSSTTGIGLCSSCHTIDRKVDFGFEANWKAQYRDPSVREFTKFSHGPHLLQMNCSDCHLLDESTNKTEQFIGFDGGLTKSNFFPITKIGCAKCHAEGQAENSCTTCHNYHVGSAALKLKDLENNNH